MTVYAAFSSVAEAAPKATDKDLQKQAEEFSVDKKGVTTLSSQELLDKVIGPSLERDELREETVMNNLRRDTTSSKLEELQSLRDKKIEAFIVNNVPDYVLVAGDKAINAYVMDNFVAPVNGEKETTKLTTVWKSTNDAISIPITEVPQLWSPTIVNVEPSIVVEEKSEKSELDNEEISALAQLGISEKELAEMLGNNGDDLKSPKAEDTQVDKKKAAEEQELAIGNVIIENISVKRIVMMGTSNFIDVDIDFKELRGDLQRKINKSFKKIKEGHLFEIEGNRFEVVSIEKNKVVFENLETRSSYRKLID